MHVKMGEICPLRLRGTGTRGFAGAGQDCLDFDSGVWDFDGGNRNAVRGLHLGDRQGNSKKGEL